MQGQKEGATRSHPRSRHREARVRKHAKPRPMHKRGHLIGLLRGEPAVFERSLIRNYSNLNYRPYVWIDCERPAGICESKEFVARRSYGMHLNRRETELSCNISRRGGRLSRRQVGRFHPNRARAGLVQFLCGRLQRFRTPSHSRCFSSAKRAKEKVDSETDGCRELGQRAGHR